MEQAPGPRGSPHAPQGGAGLALAALSPPTAKLESCWSSRLLSHLGQVAFWLPSTIASKRCRHSRQMYSKIGIVMGSAKIMATSIIKLRRIEPIFKVWLKLELHRNLTHSCRADTGAIA